MKVTRSIYCPDLTGFRKDRISKTYPCNFIEEATRENNVVFPILFII